MNKRTIAIITITTAIFLGAVYVNGSMEQAEAKALEQTRISREQKDAPKYELNSGYKEINCAEVTTYTKDSTKYAGKTVCEIVLSEEDENVRIFRGEGTFAENTELSEEDL